MTRLALFLIARCTPRADREWILGDTLEELARREQAFGRAAARRWLHAEARRVLRHALARRFTPRFTPRPHPRAPKLATGDRAVFTTRLSATWQDLRYALRTLRRSPGFTVIAVLTLALGIGATSAMFAVVHAVLLKPLPFADADHLMLVHRLRPDTDAGPGVYLDSVWSIPKYRTFLDLQRTFSDTAIFASRDFAIAGSVEPARVRGEVISDRYPAILGVTPMLGRAFTADEANREGAPAVAMIGHGLWTRVYAADPHILGRQLQINGAPYTIVGVLPRGFRGLNGDAELWTPIAVSEPFMLPQRTNHSYTIVARRRAERSEAQAMAAVRTYGRQIDEAFADGGRSDPASPGARALSLAASRADEDVRRVSWVVLGAVGFVLLIACVNLTNLLAARALGRRREMAIRGALGASRMRLARQLSAEGAMLAALGAIGGLVVAVGLLQAASVLLPDSDVFFRTPMAPGLVRIEGAAGLTRIGAGMIGLDAATLVFTGGLALVCALLVSVMPALQGSAWRPLDGLKQAGGSSTARGQHTFGARSVLVASQMALALILLAGAGLMVRSAQRLQATSIGVTSDQLLTARIDLPRVAYTPETGRAFYARLVERVRTLPGVTSVGLGDCVPVSGGCSSTGIWFPPAGRVGGGNDPGVGVYWVTPELFGTVGTPLLRGRNFTDRDRAGQPRVAIVNDAAARAFWPNADPIGRTIAVGQGGVESGAMVVGVVANVRYQSIETAPVPDVYVPFAQSYQSRMRLFVRGALDPASLAHAIRGEVRALDPSLPLSEVKTMGERVGDAMWRTRVSAWLLSGFAALALLLTAIGLFGVMAQTVLQRTAEIGIRLALGAERRHVMTLVLGRASLVTGAGLLLGLAGALGLTRLIATLLYDVEPNDPLTLAAVALGLTLVALAACYVPLRRATRVDAIVALRAD